MSASLFQFGFPAAFACFALGALVSLALATRESEKLGSTLAHLFAAAGSLIGLLFGLAALVSGTVVAIDGGGLGIAASFFTFRIDALSAFFIAVISAVALAASIYGIGYQKHFFGVYRLAPFGVFYNIFLAGMFLVVAGNNALMFLFAWEVMTISSYFLVIFERKHEENVSAGVLYLLISQLGAAFLFVAFLIIGNSTGSWDFDVLRNLGSGLPPFVQHAALAFALVGFATKAGVIPLHIWLPEAHPAAPSHVSALMSGVMIKTAIFMMVRFFVEFFPANMWWGLFILVLGAVSSLLGVLYALSEHDIKRLLAFHSVENIGIILMGVGASIAFFAVGAPALGLLALVAGLYHTANHAFFKSLLFLSAGSVVAASGTRNMEEYGGLIKKMPWTAAFFLVGAVAISGLPPFNGFVSEWLTFQSLFAGIAELPLAAKAVFLLGASSLAFTGGLAAACFVKAFGATFLARPRGEVAAHCHEASVSMKLPMAFLATLCLVLGIGASSVGSALQQVAQTLRGASAEPLALTSPAAALSGTFTPLSMTYVAVALFFSIGLVYLAVTLLSRNRKVVISRTWDCGYPLTSRMEITATGFSRSIITVFRGLLRPSIQKSAEYHDAAMRYFAKTRAVHLFVPNLYRTYLYEPAALFVEKSALRARRIQTGNLNAYLLYIFLTTVLLLLFALA